MERKGYVQLCIYICTDTKASPELYWFLLVCIFSLFRVTTAIQSYTTSTFKKLWTSVLHSDHHTNDDRNILCTRLYTNHRKKNVTNTTQVVYACNKKILLFENFILLQTIDLENYHITDTHVNTEVQIKHTTYNIKHVHKSLKFSPVIYVWFISSNDKLTPLIMNA